MTSNRLAIRFSLFAALSILFSSGASVAQEPIHTGRPLWKTYDTRQTGAAPVTHKAVLDKQGVIYAANDAGLLLFDGVRWQLIELGIEKSEIQALVHLDDGAWLVGGRRTLGLLSPNETGELSWTDLWARYGIGENQSFDSVLDLVKMGDTRLIMTDRSVLLMEDDKLSELVSVAPSGLNFIDDDTLYIETENGIIQIQDGVADDIATPAGWSDLETVTVLLPINESPLLVTRRSGLFKVSIEKNRLRLAPLWNELPVPLDTAVLSSGARLNDGSYLLGTEKGAVINLSEDGVTRFNLDQRAGYPVGVARSILPMADRSVMVFHDGGAVWLGLSSPLRVWDSVNGLPAPANSVIVDEATTFVGTSEGLYRTLSGHRTTAVPEIGPLPISTLNRFSRSTIRNHTSILIGREDGLFDYFDNRLESITAEPPNAVHISKTQPTRIAIASADGIHLANFNDGVWRNAGRLGPDRRTAALALAETSEGQLVSVFSDGTLRTYDADQWLAESLEAETQPISSQNFARKSPPGFLPFFSGRDERLNVFLSGPPLRLDSRVQTFDIDVELATQMRALQPPWVSAALTQSGTWLQTRNGVHVLPTNTDEAIFHFPSGQTGGTYDAGTVFYDEINRRVLIASPNGVSEASSTVEIQSKSESALQPINFRKVSVDSQHLYGGHGPLPLLTVTSTSEILVVDVSVIDWDLECPSAWLELQAGNETSRWPLNNACSAYIGREWSESPSESYVLTLVDEQGPLSQPTRLNINFVQTWVASAAVPLVAAVFTVLAVLSGQIVRRQALPEPVFPALSIYAGLLLLWAAALATGIGVAASDFRALVGQLAGLAVASLALLVIIEGLMKMRNLPKTSST